jgi:hypothetical protein
LEKAYRGLEATIEGGREHKEDLQEDFQEGFTKNQTPPKTIVNWKKLVIGIDKPKYKTTELKIIFSPLISDRDQ